MCIYIYIINIHSTHTYIMQTKTLILDAINRLIALIYLLNYPFMFLFSLVFLLFYLFSHCLHGLNLGSSLKIAALPSGAHFGFLVK